MSAASSTSSPRAPSSTRPSSNASPRPSAAINCEDAVINGRGVRLDRDFVTAAMDLAFRERTAINLKLQELTHGAITSVDQNARFLAAVNGRGHAMTTINKRAVAQVLAHKPDDYVRQLLELRQIGARAAVNKFKRMLAFASPHDDRLRGTLANVWHGDRTLDRARATIAKSEDRTKAACRSRWSIQFAAAIAPRSPNMARRSRCSAISPAPRSAPPPAWSSRAGTSRRSKASSSPGSPAKPGSSSPTGLTSRPATRRSSRTG